MSTLDAAVDAVLSTIEQRGSLDCVTLFTMIGPCARGGAHLSALYGATRRPSRDWRLG